MSAARALVIAGTTLLPSIVIVGVPVWLIQPFAPQTADALAWSWRLKVLAPGVTLGLGFVALAAVVAALRGADRSSRGGIARTVGLVMLLAGHAAVVWFARQNHFEWMFRPFPDPRFVAAAAATDVEPDEPVIGVARGGDAVAFPVTRIGYHHLVNTALGDVPIVGTY